MTDTPQWFKSSYSNNGGQCIEVATNLLPAHGIIPVRDSKRTDGPPLKLPAGAFSAFMDGVKAGRLGAV
ncbi:DUF397 domain-containing protein [Streptomyces sp. NPDC090119]|uniref:DUF397 domain-containing protein n=1 Tax=Streptomyces sp. NPDC090119 TaxID=3365951 RepID=UPI00381F619D